MDNVPAQANLGFLEDSFGVTRIHSWGEAMEALFDFPYRDEWKRYAANYMFRGLSDSAYALTTVLQRTYATDALAKREASLLRHFINRAHEDVRDPEMSSWHWLALSRHHGLPTRLLDWTASPLVALYFAVCNIARHNCDGLVWRVDFERLNNMLPGKLRKALGRKTSSVLYIGQLTESGIASLEELEPFEVENEPFAFALEPPSIDARIINQNSVYTLMSDCTARLDEWLAAHPQCVKVYAIDAAAKREILAKLMVANISPRTLFPGMDGLADSLKMWYGPWQVEG